MRGDGDPIYICMVNMTNTVVRAYMEAHMDYKFVFS